VISVVIPTYNDAHFLPTALGSCLAQSVPVHIVLVDDASTVPFPDEVNRFIADHQDIVTVVRHAWNCGLSAARNSGIAQARFDLVIPLDTDDWFLPGTLAPLAALMTDDVDVVYGNVVDSGQLYEPVKKPLRREDFLQDNPLFCSSLFRRQMWQAVGGYTVRQGPHYEDWNFWAKAFKAGFRFRYAPITVYEHRSRPESMLRHLHPERPRYVGIATEPLREPDPPATAKTAVAESQPGPAGPRLTGQDVLDPSLRSERVDAVLRVLAGEAGEQVAAGIGCASHDLGESVRRFVEHGARGLSDGGRKSPEVLLLHAKIGTLMIELERTKGAAAKASAKSPALVSTHATIGRLLLQRGHDPAANGEGS
jgi:hypothetical protein